MLYVNAYKVQISPLTLSAENADSFRNLPIEKSEKINF